MAASLKFKSSSSYFPPRLWALLHRQYHYQRFSDSAELLGGTGPKSNLMVEGDGHSSPSRRWKKVASRTLGIRLSMIPDAPRIVLRLLQNQGHDAYLVGGCVRDLLLNRIPKDFDVITTATLPQIKNKFHRAFIVGRKFPICRVHVRASVIEVSSFDTVALHAKDQDQELDLPQNEMPPKGFDQKDVMRWRNSLHRDFTINSLFYDPFAQKVYDYSNAITDLTAMKLRTLVPAHVSFQQDCARILRGLRIAARLGLSLAKDTEKAMRTLYASVATLDKARLMMELNYMLSYGAAEPSVLLLKRFNLLELLLPFHAAYLADLSGARNPVMLMKLFFNLDRVVSCDQPCDSGLWVSLLAFHLALVNNPQDALVVWTFSSLLYYGKWNEGVKAARELSVEHVHFEPEILKSSNDVTDEELAQRVAEFASSVLDSIDALTDSECLSKAMGRYPSSASSGLVFISKNAGKGVAGIFDVLVDNIESLCEERHYYSVNYELLGKGDMLETRFVLGKIIMNTMRSGMAHCRTKLVTEKKDDLYASKPLVQQLAVEMPAPKVCDTETPECMDRSKRGLCWSDDQLHQQIIKKQKHNKKTSVLEQKLVKEKLGEILSCHGIAKKKQRLKKVVVKDVKKLLSAQKDTLEDANLERGKHSGAQIPKELPSVLEKVPRSEKQSPKKIPSVPEKLPRIGKQHAAPGEILSVLEKVPNVTKQRKTKANMEILNVSSLSSLFEGANDPTKTDDRAGKQPAEGDQCRDKSGETKRTLKLSSIFK